MIFPPMFADKNEFSSLLEGPGSQWVVALGGKWKTFNFEFNYIADFNKASQKFSLYEYCPLFINLEMIFIFQI
jgi:hypothetical protein